MPQEKRLPPRGGMFRKRHIVSTVREVVFGTVPVLLVVRGPPRDTKIIQITGKFCLFCQQFMSAIFILFERISLLFITSQ